MKKLVVITGASSGIGKELAINFSKQGHPLLLLSRRVELMEDLNLDNCLCKSVDVTDLNSMQQAISEAESIYGPCDLLINCAGVMLLGDCDTQDYSEWEQMIDVNLKGVLTGIKSVLSDMKTRQSGTIINISSIAGFKTFDQHAVYCASKYGVHALSEAMRKEVASDNVRICLISPGVVETPLLSHTTDESIKEDYKAWKESIDQGLDPKYICDCANLIYQMPQENCIREITIAKTKQLD